MRTALESRIGIDMKDYKEYIDNEMMVTMAQMDKPSRILDYLYLVSNNICFFCQIHYIAEKYTVIYLSFSPPQKGSEWNAANFEELHKNKYTD